MKLKEEDLPPTDGVWERLPLRLHWHSKLNGHIHNSLGPAIIYDDETRRWYINGELHRLDGPAIEWADGHKEWYVDGKWVSEQDFPSAVISFLLGVDEEIAKIVKQKMKL